MTTKKQLQANRRNAQKGTGPKTTKGKAASSRNAMTYGIFSQGLIIEGEDPAEYGQLLQALIDDLKPAGALELIHVERIAMSIWRLRRLMRAESAAVGFRHAANDTRKMLTDSLGVLDSAKFKDKHLEPFGEEEGRTLGSFAAMAEELSSMQTLPADVEELKKAAPVYYSYLESLAQENKWTVEYFLLVEAQVSAEKISLAIGKQVAKDRPMIDASFYSLEKQLQVSMMREKYQEMKAIPPEAELYVRYQATLDNSLSKAIKAFREAREMRLSVLENVIPLAENKN